MPNNLKGRVAVVAGSGQGIGRAIAIAMAQEGAKVVTNNRKRGSTGAFVYDEEFQKSITAEQRERIIKRNEKFSADAETVAKEIIDMGGEAVPFFGDIGDYEVAGRLIQTAVDSFGRIDILVNNAGTFGHAPVWEMSKETWHYVVDNKPTGAFYTIRHAAPFMIEQKWGRILNCTSAAWLGTVDTCNYGAANAGIVGLTRAVARELWPYGITCNAYSPSAMTRANYSLWIRFQQREQMGMPVLPKERLEQILSEIDTKRGPEYMAPMIAYLATEAAANISGTVFQASVEGSTFERFSEPVVVKSINKPEGLWTVDELIEAVPDGLLEGYISPAG